MTSTSQTASMPVQAICQVAKRREPGLAVALATSPRVLFADEPTGQVDAAAEERVLDLLGRQRAAGTAILIATHSQALAGRADRVIRLEDGRIVDV